MINGCFNGHLYVVYCYNFHIYVIHSFLIVFPKTNKRIDNLFVDCCPIFKGLVRYSGDALMLMNKESLNGFL